MARPLAIPTQLFEAYFLNAFDEEDEYILTDGICTLGHEKTLLPLYSYG